MSLRVRGHSRAAAALLLGALPLLVSPRLLAEDPPDPGKGFDYVFYGYSPPAGKGGPGNRAMLLLDIDDPASPRPYPDGPKFKLLAANLTVSGELDVLTSTPSPATVIGVQDNHPARFIFSFQGPAEQGQVSIDGNAVLETDGRHYLRAVIDVVHNGQRTRYLVNCPTFVCDVR